jgi:hypothetical protein
MEGWTLDTFGSARTSRTEILRRDISANRKGGNHSEQRDKELILLEYE